MCIESFLVCLWLHRNCSGINYIDTGCFWFNFITRRSRFFLHIARWRFSANIKYCFRVKINEIAFCRCLHGAAPFLRIWSVLNLGATQSILVWRLTSQHFQFPPPPFYIRIIVIYLANQQMHTDKICPLIYYCSPMCFLHQDIIQE